MNTRHLIKNVNENSGGWSVMIKTVIVTIDRKLPNLKNPKYLTAP